MKRFGIWFAVACLAVLLSLAGCSMGGGGEDVQPASVAQHDDLAKQFGNHVLKGDWTSAYAMTTSAYQATTTQAAMQKEYDDLAAEILKDDSTYKPNMVDVGHGDLPTDEKEAREDLHFKTVPPKSEWLAWLFSEIGEGDKDGIERGISAELFVVNDNGQPRFGHVEFEFMD